MNRTTARASSWNAVDPRYSVNVPRNSSVSGSVSTTASASDAAATTVSQKVTDG